MKYLLDSNIIAELISEQPNQDVIEWLDQLDPGSVYISVITIGELRKGIEQLPVSKRHNSVTAWLERDLLMRFHGKIADVTTDVMLIWGSLTGRLADEGKSMPAMDSLVAAIALQGNYTLVTRNDEDFKHTGIMVINPWKLLARL